MGVMLEKLVLLSLIRAVCLWIMPSGTVSTIADQGLRMITLCTLLEQLGAIREGLSW